MFDILIYQVLSSYIMGCFHLDNPQSQACLCVAYMFFVYFHIHTVYHPTVPHTNLLVNMFDGFFQMRTYQIIGNIILYC